MRKYLTCTFPVGQPFVILCYMVVKWSGLNIPLKYRQNLKITMWIENMPGEHLLQLTEKVWSEDMTMC